MFFTSLDIVYLTAFSSQWRYIDTSRDWGWGEKTIAKFHCVHSMDLFYLENIREALFDEGHDLLQTNGLWKRNQRY